MNCPATARILPHRSGIGLCRFLGTSLMAAAALAIAHAAEPAPASGFAKGDAAKDLPETVIDCEGQSELVRTETETTATFKDHVVVTGNNMRLTCDFLKVVVLSQGNKGAILGKHGEFKSLVAVGHVKIVQAERVAECGKAEVFPGEDRLVLEKENPDNPAEADPSVHSSDSLYQATAPRLTFYRGQEKAVIDRRGKFILPPIKDLGLGKTDRAKVPPADEPAQAPTITLPKTTSP